MGEYYLIHHGILGQKWGVRRYQNSDGTLTPAGQKRHDKVANTESAAYLLKNKKYLNDDEFNKAFTRVKNNQELRKMAGKDKTGVSREVAIRVGEKAVTTALKAGVVAGAAIYLTKTESGKALVKKGERAVATAIKNAAKETAINTADVAKSAGKAVRTSNAKSFAGAVKNGNSVAKGIYTFGKAVDNIRGR